MAFGNVQADIVDSDLFTVSFGQVPGFNERRVYSILLLSP